MLGFCYGLLVSECIGAAESVGLDFQMGFFHRPRAGRPSLALDLAEELRAMADRFVVALVRRRQVGSDSFVHMPGGGVYLSDDGRKRLIKEWEAHKEADIHHQVARSPDRAMGVALGPGDAARPPLARRPAGVPPVRVAVKRWTSSSPTTSPTRKGLGTARLKRIADVCGKYGQRVQLSVFECRLSAARLARLIGEVEDIIDRQRDSVIVYRFPGRIEDAKIRCASDEVNGSRARSALDALSTSANLQ